MKIMKINENYSSSYLTAEPRKNNFSKILEKSTRHFRISMVIPCTIFNLASL